MNKIIALTAMTAIFFAGVATLWILYVTPTCNGPYLLHFGEFYFLCQQETVVTSQEQNPKTSQNPVVESQEQNPKTSQNPVVESQEQTPKTSQNPVIEHLHCQSKTDGSLCKIECSLEPPGNHYFVDNVIIKKYLDSVDFSVHFTKKAGEPDSVSFSVPMQHYRTCNFTNLY